ncbi:MAG TPA: hypothetical protein VM260_13020, partial [Pirellula sp.]|nr:hypothetical protein [Pirellula sp.]
MSNSTESPGTRSSLPKVHLTPEDAPRNNQSKSTDRTSIAVAPDIQLASHVQGETPKKPAQGLNPLKLPDDLPGADTPPMTLPRLDAQDQTLDPIKKKENILKLYTELTQLSIEPDALPDGSNGF